MRKTISTIALLTVITLLALSDISHAETLSEQVCSHISNMIEGQEVSPKVAYPFGVPAASPLLSEFYEGRGFRPAWSDDFGPSPDAEDFLEVIRSAYREGLNPQDYHLDKIEAVLSDLYASQMGLGTYDLVKLADLDLTLTQAFFLYASHLANGRVDHRNIYPDWVVDRESADLTALLSEAVDSGDMQNTLADLAPHYSKYVKLREELINYRAIAESGGWPNVPGGPKLMKGSRGKRVAILRQRLIASETLLQWRRETL